MSEKEVIVKKDHEAISTYTAFLIEDLIKKIKNTKKDKINIAFSGGSTPILMFEKLAKLTTLDWKDINIFLVDERYVNNSHQDSNYNMIKKHLLKNIEIPFQNIHHMNYQNNIEQSLKDYKDQLQKCFNFKNNEIPIFDIIHLGIGRDGHTASIFAPEQIDNSQLLSITHGESFKRITFTFKIINKAKNIIFLSTGQRKQNIVKEVINKNQKYPASLVNNQGNIFYLLDEEAAKKLS